jgi:hypothetical protein
VDTYKIGSIALSADGTWTAYWVGNHVDGFGPGNLGSKDLDLVLKILKTDLLKNQDKYLERIKENEQRSK